MVDGEHVPMVAGEHQRGTVSLRRGKQQVDRVFPVHEQPAHIAKTSAVQLQAYVEGQIEGILEIQVGAGRRDIQRGSLV